MCGGGQKGEERNASEMGGDKKEKKKKELKLTQ